MPMTWPSMEHDLVTALWERDLSHIDYKAVDPFLGGGVLREGMVDALRETVLRRLEVAQVDDTSPEHAARSKMRQVQPRRLESSSLQLTSEEVERGERAIEDLSSVLEDYAEVLLEIARNVFITAANDVLIQSLAAVVAAFIEREDVDRASFILERLGELETQRWCPAGSVGFVAAGAITADRIRPLLQGVGQLPTDKVREAQGFFESVRRWIVPPLLEILTETNDRAVRKTILEILGGEDAVPWRDLEPLVQDPRWYVTRNAVQLAAAAGHEDLADHSRRLLGHRDVQVRREMVRALGTAKGSRGPERPRTGDVGHRRVRAYAGRERGRPKGRA